MVAYRLAVANTVTGQVVGDLPFTAVPTWSRALNGSGTLSGVAVPLNPTRLDSDMARRLREPWRWTVLWCYGQSILQAGILSSVTVDDTQKPSVASLSTTTVWEFLTRKRLVVTPGQDIGTDAANVVFGPSVADAANRGLSLHSIARRLVELATVNADPTYRLPIVLPNPIAGTNVRTYLGSDLATTGTRLAELTQVDQGPEVEFSPEFGVSTQGYFRWRMRVGNNRLGQLGFPHAWDYQRALLSLSTGIDGVDMTFQVTSKGQDTRTVSSATPPVASGALISAATSDTLYTAQGWPALQTADTGHTSTIDTATVQGYANAAVTTHKVPVQTATARISINGLDNQGRQTGAPGIDLIAVGDTAFVGLVGHPLLADGQYGMRILTLESGADAYTAKMVVQVLSTGFLAQQPPVIEVTVGPTLPIPDGDILIDTDGVPYYVVGATIALDTDGVPYIAGPSTEVAYDTDGVPYLRMS